MSEDWICERTYQVVVNDEVKPFLVRWMRPAPDPVGDWSCCYRLEWPHRSHVDRKAFGVDSVQALYSAMQNAASELYTVEPSIFWFEPDDVLGLPVASSIADLEAERTKGRP